MKLLPFMSGSKMRKLTVISLALLVLVVGLAILLLANLNRLVKRNKGQILAKSEQALGRKVSVGEINVSVWGGIGVRLENLALADDRSFSSGDFVRAQELQVQLKLLPLLRKEFQIKRLILRRPAITVIRDKKGVFNFSSIGAQEKAQDAKEAKKEKAEPAPVGAAATALLVSRLEVSEGQIRLLDRKEATDLRISQVDLKVKDFSFNRPFHIELSAALLDEKQNLKIQTRIGPLDHKATLDQVPLEAKLELNQLLLERLKRAFPGIQALLPKDLHFSRSLQLKDVELKGTLKDLGLRGTLELTGSAIDFRDMFHKPEGTIFLLSVDSQVREKDVALKSAKLRLHTLDLTGEGKVKLEGTPALDLALASGPTELKGWEKILPILKPYDPSGSFQARVRIKGDLEKGKMPQINGSVTLEDVGLQVPVAPKPIKDLKMKAALKGTTVEVDQASFRLGQSRMVVTAKVLEVNPLSLTYRFSSPELWLSDLLPKDSKEETKEVLKTVRSEGKLQHKNGSISYEGTLSSTQGSVANVNYTHLKTALSVVDQTITVKDLSLGAFKGLLRGGGRIQLRGASPQFNLSSKIQGLDLKEYFRAVHSSAPQHIEGRLNADVVASASGKTWEAIKPSLRGKGKTEVVGGKLNDFNLAEGVLSGMTGIPGLTGLINPRVKERYPEIFTAQTTDFEELAATFDISDGRVNIKDLGIKAADYVVRGKGWVDLDKRLDFSSVLILSQRLSADLVKAAKEAQYIFGEQGRMEIAFGLKGTLPNVKPRLDQEHLRRLVQRGLVQKGTEELRRRLSPRSEQPSQTQKEGEPTAPKKREKKPIEDLIQRGLEGLFGR